MPRLTRSVLTQSRLNVSLPADRPYKVVDSGGLFLLVKPSGARGWRFRYRWGGREKMLSFGPYPEVSLAQARDRRDDARRQIKNGVDPSRDRKEKRAALTDTFAGVADEWLGKQHVCESTAARNTAVLKLLCRHIGTRSIRDIDAPDMLDALRVLERHSIENAKRARQLASAVYQYAIASRRATHDPAAGLVKALPPSKTIHHPALTESRQVGALLRAIDGYAGQPATVTALKVLAMTFVRSVELRHAEWPEFDLDAAQWLIPASRMKLRREHLVPLPTQAVAMLPQCSASRASCSQACGRAARFRRTH